MFQKKEYIFSESLGVCRVDDIAKLSSKSEEQRLYYVLKPEFDRSKTSYIPVEGHKVLLRELISKERAAELFEQGLDHFDSFCHSIWNPSLLVQQKDPLKNSGKDKC